MYFRKQQIFDCTGKIPRPKPIESMCLFGGIFNVGKEINKKLKLSQVFF